MTTIASKIFKIKQKKLDDFYHPGTAAEYIILANKTSINEATLLTDEELIEEVMNNSNGEDEEDDDAIDVLGPVCPKASDAQDKMQVFCVACTIEHVKSV